MTADDGGGWAAGACGGGFGGAEDGDDWGAEELGEVHGAGVVGEEETALAEAGGEIFDGGFSGEVFCGGADERGELGAHVFFGGGAEDKPVAGEFGGDLAGGFGEAVEGPAFGGAVFCACAEPEGEREGRFGRWEDGVVEGGVVDVGAETPCDAEVESGVVFDGADFFLGRDDLVEEFAAPVALVADDAEDAGEFHFEGGAETVGEEDAGVPWVAGIFEEPGDGEDRGVFREGDDLVDVRDHAPDGGDFFRDEDGDACVGAATFEGADGGDSHAGIAEPVGRADEDVEGLEGIWGHGGREGDAAAVLCEEEFWVGGFPAVVDPEPVVRGAADIGFEGEVE